MHPLVEEAMKKAAIVWLSTGGRPYGVWCLWVDDALYVVSGPGEQPAPGLAEATGALVTARGDHGGRVGRAHVGTPGPARGPTAAAAGNDQDAGEQLEPAGSC